MMILSPPTSGSLRIGDASGGGTFLASRSKGRRRHVGIDWLPDAGEGAIALGMGAGRSAKIGTMYADDPTYKYVEVACADLIGVYYRVAYVQPLVDVGERVDRWQPIGLVLDVGDYYRERAIRAGREPTPPPVHLHVEVWLEWGVTVYQWPGVAGAQWTQDNRARLCINPLMILDTDAQPPGGWPDVRQG